MKTTVRASVCILGLCVMIICASCANKPQYDFSLKNTLSIFLLNDGNDYYFCIPVQYMGDYHIGRFEFTNGNILIGDYDIALNRDDITISVYLNEASDEDGSADDGFNLMYLEENGSIVTSKMDEPLTNMLNHYYIFIEKHLNDDDLTAIIKEYEKGNVYSKVSIWYDMSIDNEEQNGSGMLDDFELYNGPAGDTAWFPPNLNFFKAKYLQ